MAGNGPFFEKCLAKSQEGQQLLNAVNCQFRVCNKYRRGRSLQSCHTSSLGELSESSKMCSTKEPIGDVNVLMDQTSLKTSLTETWMMTLVASMPTMKMSISTLRKRRRVFD